MAQLHHIDDFHSPALDLFARTTENQLLRRDNPKEALFLAESPGVISLALDAGCEPVAFLMETAHLSTKAPPLLARCPDNIPVYTAEFEVLTQLTGYKLTRGMLCAMRRPALPSPEALCRQAKRLVVLEEVMNPTNVGAIFRSAAALGMDAVLLTHGCSDPLYRRACRVSMGTVFQIPWTFLPKGVPWTQFCKEQGFITVAMALRQDTLSLHDPILRCADRLALALGSEGYGLAKESIDHADYTVKIPMAHGVDSLNVAAASAVAFYQLGAFAEKEDL